MQINHEPVKRIGSGSFMTAYRGLNTSSVYLRNRKSAMEYTLHELYTIISGKHIPQLVKIDQYTYSAPFYKSPRRGTAAYKLAKQLEESRLEYYANNRVEYFRAIKARETTYNFWYTWYESICGIFPESITDDIESIISMAHSYVDNIMFEFNNSNVAALEDGTLILRDVVFSPPV